MGLVATKLLKLGKGKYDMWKRNRKSKRRGDVTDQKGIDYRQCYLK